MFWLFDLGADWVAGRSINKFRRTFGLKPVRRVFRSWWHSPQRLIGLWPEWFAAPQPDWPPNTSVAGFIDYDGSPTAADSEVLPNWQEAVKKDDEGPVVFTAGSAMKHAHEFFALSVDACQRLGRRGILLTQYPDQVPSDLPDGIEQFDFLPFGELFPMAAAIVHHAGILTMARALSAGIPQLLFPMSFDQFDNAHGLLKLGVAECISRNRFTSENVTSALDRLLNSKEVAERCDHYAKQGQDTAVLEQICELVEALVGTDADRTAQE